MSNCLKVGIKERRKKTINYSAAKESTSMGSVGRSGFWMDISTWALREVPPTSNHLGDIILAFQVILSLEPLPKLHFILWKSYQTGFKFFQVPRHLCSTFPPWHL